MTTPAPQPNRRELALARRWDALTVGMKAQLHERAIASLEADGEVERRMWVLLRQDMEREDGTR